MLGRYVPHRVDSNALACCSTMVRSGMLLRNYIRIAGGRNSTQLVFRSILASCGWRGLGSSPIWRVWIRPRLDDAVDRGAFRDCPSLDDE